MKGSSLRGHENRIVYKTSALTLGAFLVVALLGEGLARLLVLPELSLESNLRQVTPDSPERLYPPGYRAKFDARGLYPGASIVELRVSQKRLIEPADVRSAKRHILFLGGSSTEALSLPEDERWVARLNSAPGLSTFNAGMGAAHVVDAIHNFEHLTRKQGLRFDLVVLMTTVNDFVWMRALERVGGTLRTQGYVESLRRWLASDRDEILVDPGLAWREKIVHASRLLYFLLRTVNEEFLGGAGWSPAHLTAAEFARKRIRQQREGTAEGYTSLERCPGLEEQIVRFREVEAINIAELAGLVRKHGADLLILSEPTSFGAPAESFYEDFRTSIECGFKLLTLGDSHPLAEKVTRVYLEAARLAGATTFDLAAAMPGNGSQGGRYFYDGVHQTPAGNELQARLLEPVLEGLVR